MAFHACTDSLVTYLVDAGYPPAVGVQFSAERRNLALGSSRERPFGVEFAPSVSSHRSTSRHDVYLVLPYNVQMSQLKLCSLFRSHVSCVIPLELRLAWTIQPNAMRKLYRLNWPRLARHG